MANPLVRSFVGELHHRHGIRLKFRFLSRPATPLARDTILAHVVGPNREVGIGDSDHEFRPIWSYTKEETADPAVHTAGRDGGIIIRAFNPYFPDKTILIIAGFEEPGTLAAAEVLQKPSEPLLAISNREQRARSVIELVVETDVMKRRPTAARIVQSRFHESSYR